MSKNTDPLPEWELVLSSAARLQRILPEAILVGRTASAIHAEHRFSRDADHVLPDLRTRFDRVLAQLESVAGWKPSRVRRPVQILGSLDGIETGVRQLIRDEPLETEVVSFRGESITVPTEGEILRIGTTWTLSRCPITCPHSSLLENFPRHFSPLRERDDFFAGYRPLPGPRSTAALSAGKS